MSALTTEQRLEAIRQADERRRAHERSAVRNPGRFRARTGLSGISVIIRCLRTLPQPVSYAALVLSCWRAAPALFGLPCMQDEHPDSNRVSCALYGTRGAIGRGLVRSVPGAGKRYELTEAGQQFGRE